MKKLALIIVALLGVVTSFAQGKSTAEKIKVNFYGVDFSQVSVFRATETPQQFIKAFEGINELLVSEPDKFDISKYLDVKVLSTNIEPSLKQIAELKDAKFKNKQASDINFESIIANYPSSDDNGLVIVAKELDKYQNRGTFIAVIYDGKSKKIVSEREFYGKAKGFGLRNFWAGSLYRGLSRIK